MAGSDFLPEALNKLSQNRCPKWRFSDI